MRRPSAEGPVAQQSGQEFAGQLVVIEQPSACGIGVAGDGGGQDAGVFLGHVPLLIFQRLLKVILLQMSCYLFL